MSSPYLKRDESIILTTDRVSINSLLYEVLLTSRHLILVDIRYDQFLPQKIPLSTILSVKGGKVTSGEPVITIIFSDDEGTSGSEPMVLIFTQQPGEMRKRERDEWLKNLMAHMVSVRQETITSGSPPVDVEYGIRPSSRRFGTHEKITPYTTTVDTSPAPVELTILPDESESLVVPEEDQASFGNALSETDTPPEITYSTPECEEISPVDIRESESADTLSSTEPEETVGAGPVPADEEKLPDTAITGVTADGEISAEPQTDLETEKPFALILHEALKSLLSSEENKELPDAGVFSEPRGEEKEGHQQEEPALPEVQTHPEPGVVELPTVVQEESELPGTTPSSAEEIAEPGQQPSEQAIPQIPKSPPPTPGTASQPPTLILVTTIILIILGIGIGVVFYSHDNTSPAKEPVSFPTPSLQLTTVQQISVQQTTPQPKTLPQTTVQITEVPTLVVIPTDGIWIRVVYSGNYYGRVGNPGSLRNVQGSGEQIYSIRGDSLVQLQINKNDNTGNPLTVEIYRNGELMKRQVRSAPMGSIELLIDAKTGNPPGLVPVLANETNQTEPGGELVMYF